MIFDNQETTRKGSIIRKSGSKKLYLLLYYMGRRIEKSTGLADTRNNRVVVREWLDRQQQKIDAGIFKYAEAFPDAPNEEKSWFATREGWDYNPEPKHIIFGDYLERWLEEIWTKYQSEGKKDDYKRIIDSWLSPYFGDKTFHQITGVEVQRFLGSLRIKKGKKAGEPMSGSRVRNILIVLRAIYNDACEEHHWNVADPFRFASRHIPRKRKKQPQVFRFEEWTRLMENIDPYYRPIAEFMVLTGLIASEVAGLRREDIEGDKILVQNSIVDGKEKSTLKNIYRERSIPIGKRLKEIIQKASSRSSGKYIFTMESGVPFDCCNFRKHAWEGAFKKSGITYRIPYATRHTFAAWALAAGIHPNRLVRLMGHGSKQMVYEVYGNYVEGLEKDEKAIRRYFGLDFLGA
jgi:integrase